MLSPEERQDLIRYLAMHPKAGDLMEGTGGVRKMRFGAKGKGKRGGARVIYYWYSDDAPIYALLAYGKNEKVDLKPEEAKAVVASVLRKMHGVGKLDTPAVLQSLVREPLDLPEASHVQLWPHRHGTDAMFVQLLTKV